MSNFLRNIEVGTVAEAAEEIRDLLVLAGWEVESGDPTSFPMLIKGTVVNGARPWLRYTNPSGTILRMNGDFDGGGANLSTNRDWTLGAGSRLWMAANDESSCQYIKPSSGTGDAYHAGALERLIPTDGTAIAVGLLTNSNQSANYQEAERFGTSTKWQVASLSQGLYANIFTGSNGNSSTLNLGTTGYLQVAPYFRMFSSEYRGVVPFAASGLSGALAGQEFEMRDPITDDITEIYVSSGVGGFKVFDAAA